MTLLDFSIRIALSVALGFVIGWGRQVKGHSTGIRTNVLVSVGSCMFVLFSIIMDAPDVSRIAAQIVTGVGFICTGIIFKDGGNIRGINSAATIWCTAAIGVLSSTGRVLYALLATVMLLAANLLLSLTERKVRPLRPLAESETTYKIMAHCDEEKEIPIRSTIMEIAEDTPFSVTRLESTEVMGEEVKVEATFLCKGRRRDDVAEKIIAAIAELDGVRKVGWRVA